MRLYVNVKQAGVRKPAIDKQVIEVQGRPTTLRELIASIVTQNVESYNNRVGQQNVLHYLTEQDIKDSAAVGRVHFGDIYNEKSASLEKALESAFLAYEDGIYRVFVGELEAGALDAPLKIEEEEILTFVRLAMLTGRRW